MDDWDRCTAQSILELLPLHLPRGDERTKVVEEIAERLKWARERGRKELKLTFGETDIPRCWPVIGGGYIVLPAGERYRAVHLSERGMVLGDSVEHEVQRLRAVADDLEKAGAAFAFTEPKTADTPKPKKKHPF